VILALIAVRFWLSGLLAYPSFSMPPIVVIAFLFSAAVGVIFGYFPALKAARLDPSRRFAHE